jgi:hypothetical protein
LAPEGAHSDLNQRSPIINYQFAPIQQSPFRRAVFIEVVKMAVSSLASGSEA